jgi:hypothetical protein
MQLILCDDTVTEMQLQTHLHNLRGLTESATVLSYPVYLFIIGLIIMIVVGVWKV